MCTKVAQHLRLLLQGNLKEPFEIFLQYLGFNSYKSFTGIQHTNKDITKDTFMSIIEAFLVILFNLDLESISIFYLYIYIYIYIKICQSTEKF